MKVFKYILVALVFMITTHANAGKNVPSIDCSINLTSIDDNRCVDGTGKVLVNYSITFTTQPLTANMSVGSLPANVTHSFIPTSFTSDPTDLTFSGVLELTISDANVSLSAFTVDIIGSLGCNLEVVIPAISINPNFSCATTILYGDLVFNGDFELGKIANPGVNTTYTYMQNSTPPLGDDEYTIAEMPYSGFQNHTHGGEFSMYSNDQSTYTTEVPWKQEIQSVQPNTDYKVEAWISPIATISSDEKISLVADGVNLSEVVVSQLTVGTWYRLSGVWNSGSSGLPIDLKIVINASTGSGHDVNIFIDDISFKEYGPSNCTVCVDKEMDFNIAAGYDLSGSTVEWDFGDNSATSSAGAHTYAAVGIYTVTLTISKAGCTDYVVTNDVLVEECCFDCITSFSPLPNEKYVLSAWVKEDVVTQVISYTNPSITLDFSNPNSGNIFTLSPKGEIIDGWQKIEEVITIPTNSWQVDISLNNGGTNAVYFDDIRMHPFKASMKSYVYDPVTLRLMAELDDRNYATFYQYDEEGKLIRIKKETSRGIETIQESREGTYRDIKQELNNSTIILK